METLEKIEAAIEKKQAERDNNIAILAKLEKQKKQKEHEYDNLVNRYKDEQRRSRTHRLIERGAILESFIPNAADMDNEQIKSILSAVFKGGENNATNE